MSGVATELVPRLRPAAIAIGAAVLLAAATVLGLRFGSPLPALLLVPVARYAVFGRKRVPVPRDSAGGGPPVYRGVLGSYPVHAPTHLN